MLVVTAVLVIILLLLTSEKNYFKNLNIADIIYCILYNFKKNVRPNHTAQTLNNKKMYADITVYYIIYIVGLSYASLQTCIISR